MPFFFDDIEPGRGVRIGECRVPGLIDEVERDDDGAVSSFYFIDQTNGQRRLACIDTMTKFGIDKRLGGVFWLVCPFVGFRTPAWVERAYADMDGITEWWEETEDCDNRHYNFINHSGHPVLFQPVIVEPEK